VSVRAGEIVDGRFEIGRVLGAGGMGQVYLARDLTSGEPVAVKVLLGASASDLSRFDREAEVLASLQIPGVVRYIANGATAAGCPYLAMEWLDGETLADRLDRGPLGIAESVTLARRVADALAAVHRRGVVHRDLKPGNLLLVGGEVTRVTLLDFGIARAAGLAPRQLTITGAIVGTPAYMAPEQARGLRSIDARADVFALGCVLYECIAGRPAFFATDVLSLLMKVLLEEPPRLQEVRAGVPGWIDGLVAHLLAKEPDERPPDAGAVAAALAAQEDLALSRSLRGVGMPAMAAAAPGSATLTMDAGPPGARSRRSTNPVPENATLALDTGSAAPDQGLDARVGADAHLTDSERAVLCLIVAEVTGSGEVTAARADEAHRARALREMAARYGAALDVLQGRWLLVELSGAAAPTEQAVRAAHCALAMRGLLVGSPIAIATGRAVAGAPLRAGELIARAVHLLAAGRAQADGAALPIDDVTAPLLEQRFDVLRDAAGHWLVGTRDDLSPMRRLLGKPTAFVGRDRELAMLLEEIRCCLDDGTASALLITGPAGSGKSRLRHELLSRLQASDEGVAVWTGHADPMSAGSAFALLGSALRRVLDLREGEPVELRRRKVLAQVERHRDLDGPRVAAFLGELIGVPFPDDGVELRAARRDPILMGDQLRLAWEEFLRAECAVRPILLVLEDLHWGDLPTVDFIDAALRQPRELPFIALALARPEVHEVFPGLWKSRRGQELRLNPLPRKAGERIVRQVLGDAASDVLVTKLVERAEGNAFFLEELIRAALLDQGAAFPETVLATVQARLATLEPDARRVLRAASIFGQSFSPRGVAALVGATDIAARLAELEGREILTRRITGDPTGDVEYRFQHALLREAAYGMLTERDRRTGHALAGLFLEQSGDADPMATAEHFHLGGEPARAARAYLQAAEQALRGNDLATAIERAERGMACEPEPAVAGALRLVQVEAHLWRGEIAVAEERGGEAVALQQPGSARWFSAIDQVVLAAFKAGGLERVERWSEMARDADVLPGARDEWIQCLGTCAVTLVFGGRYALADSLIEIVGRDLRASDATDPEVLARYHQARALRSLLTGDSESSLRSIEAALAAFEQAGDRRNACSTRNDLALLRRELGDFAGAEAQLRIALSAAEQMELHDAVATTQQNIGYVLTCVGKLDEAKAVQRASLESFQRMGLRRMVGAAWLYLARSELLDGDPAAAELAARAAAQALEVGPPLRPFALAVLAQALLGQGRAGEALAAAREAHAALEALGGVEEGESIIRLTFAEALAAAGHEADAAQAIAAAEAALLARADKVRDPRWRESFLNNVPEHARTRELARGWLGGRVFVWGRDEAAAIVE
jgi:tetratricopeptide (TPR) repeat protein